MTAQHALDEQMDEAEYQQLPAAKKGDSGHAPTTTRKKDDDCLVMVLLWLFLICSTSALVYGPWAGFDSTPPPRLFVRLAAVEGLGLGGVDDRCAPPVFKLAVDVDGIPEEAFHRGPLDVGGGGAMLRVSYRGVILAWGGVPPFTIDVRRLGRSAKGVATVVAKAEGSVVRQEIRNMIRAELQAFGRAELYVDGEFRSLYGHLHCKTHLFQGEATEALPPCWVEKRQNQ